MTASTGKQPVRSRRRARRESARRPWYESAFCGDYLARYQHRSDKAARAELPLILKSLKLPKDSRVLDLCCGAGRHSRALAGAGYLVTGADLSEDLLDAARAQGTKGGRIEYIRADMRDLPMDNETFDGAISMFTSFGYFPREAQNERVLRELQRVLKPGAPFLMDYFNLRATLKNLVAYSEKTIGGTVIVERRRFDRGRKRLLKTIRIECGCECDLLRESVRAYAPKELDTLLQRAGFKIEKRFGDLFGARFDSASSPRYVVLARKK